MLRMWHAALLTVLVHTESLQLISLLFRSVSAARSDDSSRALRESQDLISVPNGSVAGLSKRRLEPVYSRSTFGNNELKTINGFQERPSTLCAELVLRSCAKKKLLKFPDSVYMLWKVIKLSLLEGRIFVQCVLTWASNHKGLLAEQFPCSLCELCPHTHSLRARLPYGHFSTLSLHCCSLLSASSAPSKGA